MIRFLPLALILAGCASQAVNHPDPAWAPARRDAPASAAGVNWSDGLTLEELLNEVDRFGRARAALEEIDAARGRRLQAGTYPLNPELELEAAQGVEGDSTTVGIGVRQTIELGGRVSRREAVADAGLNRASAEAEDMRRDLRMRARKAYWASVVAEKRVDVTRRVAETMDRVTETVTARYEARQALAVDLNLAKVEAAQARAALRRAEGAAVAARAEVAVFFGPGAPAEWKLADAIPRDRPQIDLLKALAAAKGGRPDLAALGASSDEAGARADLAAAEAAPDLGLGIGYEFERDRIEGDGVDFTMNDHMVTFGLSLSLPVVNRRQGEIAEAEADRRRFAALREALATEIGRDVIAAEARLHAAADVLALYEKDILPTAEASIEAIRAAYTEGQVVISEVLQAQHAYEEARMEAVDAEAEYAEARADLEGAIGRPLEEVLK